MFTGSQQKALQTGPSPSARQLAAVEAVRVPVRRPVRPVPVLVVPGRHSGRRPRLYCRVYRYRAWSADGRACGARCRAARGRRASRRSR